MKKFIIGFIILFLNIAGCKNSSNPADAENYNKSINCPAQSYEIAVNIDSLTVEHSPGFSIDYTALKLDGINLNIVKNYYPASRYEIYVDREFKLAENDSFKVAINNCGNKYSWLVNDGTINLDGYSKWINNEITLLRTEKTTNPDGTINYLFAFKTLTKGKGYISFIEADSSGSVSSATSHGLIIGYTTDALKVLNLKLDEITWKYSTKPGSFSTVSVRIKGTTNAYRLRGMTYGDGIAEAMEIPINNNDFQIEVPVAFSNVEGTILKSGTELLLYGTAGLPKVITLANPAGSD